MKQFQRGQIWLVNFDPSTGHEYRKIRPALIIQHDFYLDSGLLITVLPISSQTGNLSELDILLRSNSQNRLIKDSLIKTKHISSFDKRRFIKLIGKTDALTMEIVDVNLQAFLFGYLS